MWGTHGRKPSKILRPPRSEGMLVIKTGLGTRQGCAINVPPYQWIRPIEMRSTKKITMVPLDSLYRSRLLYRVSLKELRLLHHFSQTRLYSGHDTPENTHLDPKTEVAAASAKDTPTNLPSEEKELPFPRITNPEIPSELPSNVSGHGINQAPIRRVSRLLVRQVAPLRIRRTPIARKVEPPRSGTWHFNPHLLSFQDQSPQAFDHPHNQFQRSVGDHNLEDYGELRDTAYDFMDNEQDIKLSDDTYESLNLDESRYEEISTITPNEKTAFQKIFKEIFENKQWEETASTYGDPSFENPEAEQLKRRQKRYADQQLSEVMNESTHRSAKTIEQISKEIDRYPPAIRPTVIEALRLEENRTNKKDDYQYENSGPFNNIQFLKEMQERRELEKRLEAIREVERDRVERLMRAAKTDFELWKVLEAEVFSLIQKLGLEDKPRHTELLPIVRPKRKRNRKPIPLQKSLQTGKFACEAGFGPAIQSQASSKALTISEEAQEEERSGPTTQKQASSDALPTPEEPSENEKPVSKAETGPSTTNQPPPDPLATEEGVSPLRLYGPLYPSYLLLGLRLLDRSFSRPSPLAIALLPKIKSMGYISRVLGASAQFYNELLLIYHFRHNDFQGMLRLLEEMELSSIVINQETLDIVYHLGKMQDKIRKGSQGFGISILWSLPNFARGKFGPWRDYLKEALDPKPMTLHKVGRIPIQPTRS
ncbi:hypothetical protein K3495_g8966 [Podosphaera aphanis]|nr:hypothetical protein K3495_g8966 [Podosphaera aphanis]